MKKKLLVILCVVVIFFVSAVPALAREDTPVAFFTPSDYLCYIRVPGYDGELYPTRFYLPPALTKPTDYAKIYTYLFARASDNIPNTQLIWNTTCVSAGNDLYHMNTQIDPNSVVYTDDWFRGFVTMRIDGYVNNNVNFQLRPYAIAYNLSEARENYVGGEPFAVTYSTTYFDPVDLDSSSPAPHRGGYTVPLGEGHLAQFDLIDTNVPEGAYVTSCEVTFPAALLLYGNTHLIYRTTWSRSEVWNNYIDSSYGLYDFVEGWQRPYEVIDFEDIDLTTWLGNALGGVFDVPLFGGITLGTVLGTCIGVAVAIFILKRFAGG